MRLSLHYNPSCPDCVRQAKRTARLDWLRAIDLRTDRSPLGEVPVGEIVVFDERSRRAYTGVYATRMVCLRVPLLFLYGLLLYLILKRPWSEIRAILLEESDEGRRLRGTHPFRGIVTEEERLVIIKRHPPAWPHVPYDAAKIPGEVMERILLEGPALSGASSSRPKHRRPGP